MINHESGLDNCDDPCVSKANQCIERVQVRHIRTKTVMTWATSVKSPIPVAKHKHCHEIERPHIKNETKMQMELS